MPGQTRYLMQLLRRSRAFIIRHYPSKASADISAIVASRLNKRVLQLQNRGGTVQRHTLRLMVSDRRNGTTRTRYVPETLGKSPSPTSSQLSGRFIDKAMCQSAKSSLGILAGRILPDGCARSQICPLLPPLTILDVPSPNILVPEVLGSTTSLPFQQPTAAVWTLTLATVSVSPNI